MGEMVTNLANTHKQTLNSVPLTLLCLYGLNSFAISFPDTAQLDFVIYTLKMELDVQVRSTTEWSL